VEETERGFDYKSIVPVAPGALIPQLASAVLFFGIGLFLAAGAHAFLFGPQGRFSAHPTFIANAHLRWMDDYKGYLLAGFGFLAAALIFRSLSVLKRLVSSWAHGMLPEVPLFSLGAALVVFAPAFEPVLFRLVISLTIIAVGSLLSHVAKRVVNVDGLPAAHPSLPAVERSRRAPRDESGLETDEPVTTWEDDLLDRGPLVDLLTRKVIALRKPVVVLNGRFGSGKSSVLNLLRLQLQGQAVAVSFSAWLPGSESTLTEFLVSDIVAECRKLFVVPGLAKSARRFANALSKSVPYLSGLTELLPSVTQRDALRQLRASLLGVPLRVVVLVDEVDRMQRAEILELLKLLRGVGGVQNLSFVCACDREQVINAIRPAEDTHGDQTREYLEKFFLDVVTLSEPTADTLQALGAGRMLRTLESCKVLRTDSEKQAFQTALARLWPRCFGPYCCNLRRVGIIANDFQGAATLLGRDADPIDAALITLLHRINPGVHRLVASQQFLLTGRFKGLKQYRYLNDSEKSQREKQLVTQIGELCASDEEKDLIQRILTELFPLFPKFLGRVPPAQSQDELGNSLKITNPWMFDAYFRLEITKEVFRGSELEQFLESLARANDADDVARAFGETLGSMEPGSDRAEDFLWKISLSISSLSEHVAKWLALSVMQFADKYVYDRDIRLWRDSLYAFRTVRETLMRIAESDRATFLRTCISEAGDDTMAYGLIARLTDLREPNAQDEGGLRIPLKAVWDTFLARMRSRYGVDAPTDEAMRTSDPEAFALWGSTDLSKWGIAAKPSDREARDDFWIRYIGTDKHRLATVFDAYFMPMASYGGDPAPFVERRISSTILRKLAADVIYAPDLTKEKAGSLRRIDRLLNGDYKDGVPLNEWRTQ